MRIGSDLDIFRNGVVFELAKNSCLILLLKLNLYFICPSIVATHFLNAESASRSIQSCF